MINIHLKDICLVSARFGLYMDRIRKYRAVMNMIQDKMFEYNHHTGILQYTVMSTTVLRLLKKTI